MRKYRETHPDYMTEYRKARRSEISEKTKAYRKAHILEYSDYMREYRKSHKSEISAWGKSRPIKNKEARDRFYKKNSLEICAKSCLYRYLPGKNKMTKELVQLKMLQLMLKREIRKNKEASK